MNNANTVIFTICSVNYLAQAKTLAESLNVFHPELKLVVGLTDRVAGKEIDLTYFEELNLLEVDKIGIDNFEQMCERYDITELNTAVKPYFFQYFFQYSDIKTVVYFDPDIYIFQKLDRLFTQLEHQNVVVTPHICSPLPTDGHLPDQLSHLQTGTFNLGFIGVAKSDESLKFIDWWCQKLKDECLIELKNGLFVDQKWIDLAINYFDKVFILKDLGYNMAYWNFHERVLTKEHGSWMINENIPLVFFHFSGYQLKKPTFFSKYQTRFSFESRADLIEIFDFYKSRLVANHNEYFEQFPCFYIKPTRVIKYRRVRIFLSEIIDRIIKLLPNS